MDIAPLRRWFLQGVVAFVLLVVVTFLMIFAANFIYRIKAESLVEAGFHGTKKTTLRSEGGSVPEKKERTKNSQKGLDSLVGPL
jgi:hypothetical protein